MSMREKIAEAIWQAEWARAGNSGSRRIQWPDNSEETMNKYRFLADAVLDTLMEPTIGMQSAALPLVGRMHQTRDIFSAMVAAAKEGK